MKATGVEIAREKRDVYPPLQSDSLLTTTHTNNMQKPFTVLMDTNHAGLTCQLCDITGHAAKSCTTHLNEVSANRTSLAQVDALEADLQKHKQRIAELDDQVKRMSILVQGAMADLDELRSELADDDDDYLEVWGDQPLRASDLVPIRGKVDIMKL